VPAHHDLQQQPGGALAVGDEHVGHDGAHDLTGVVHLWLDREQAPMRAVRDAGEMLAGCWRRGVERLPRGATPALVDPVIGVRRPLDLCDHSHTTSGQLARSRTAMPADSQWHDVIARVVTGDLRLGNAPPVADHRPSPIAAAASVAIRMKSRPGGSRFASAWLREAHWSQTVDGS